MLSCFALLRRLKQASGRGIAPALVVSALVVSGTSACSTPGTDGSNTNDDDDDGDDDDDDNDDDKSSGDDDDDSTADDDDDDGKTSDDDDDDDKSSGDDDDDDSTADDDDDGKTSDDDDDSTDTSDTDLTTDTDVPMVDPKEFENDFQRDLSDCVYFYGAQRCGDANNWILVENSSGTSCHPDDGPDAGSDVDLTGGWHDAGDFIKFSLTNSYASYVLLKAYEAFPQSFKDRDDVAHSGKSNDVPDVLDQVTHSLDYIARLLIDDKTYVNRIGGDQDHDTWVTSPYQSGLSVDEGGGQRPVMTEGKADVAGMSAAALALGAKIFKTVDADRSDTYLKAAKAHYAFAMANPGSTDDNFYKDDNWEDNVFCAAVELYRATDDESFSAEANALDDKIKQVKWVLDWANPVDLCRFSFALTGDKETLAFWTDDVKWYIDQIAKTGELEGLAYFGLKWGTLRYANNAAFSAGLLWKVTKDEELRKQLRDFVTSQVGWARGDSHYGHSFIVGVAGSQSSADNAPHYPHHKNAYGRDLSEFPDGSEEPLYVLTGAMVGGPDEDGWSDDLTDFERNEVSIDYNAAIVGSLAAIAYMELVD